MEVHNDPEFVGLTFGEGPRDWMLAQLCPGDYVFFVASMKKIAVPSRTDFLKNPKSYSNELKKVLKRNRGPEWFFGLIGQIRISQIFAGKHEIERYNLYGRCRELDATVKDILKINAHIKRGDPYEDYTIIKGEESESKIYSQALPISNGNTPLNEFQNIFHNHVLKRNNGKMV